MGTCAAELYMPGTIPVDRPPDPAGIPYERIIPAVHLVTEDLP